MDNLCLYLILRKYETQPLPPCLVPYLLYDAKLHLWLRYEDIVAEVYMSDDLRCIYVDDGKRLRKSFGILNENQLLFLLSQCTSTILDEVLYGDTAYGYSTMRNAPGIVDVPDSIALGKMYLHKQI